MLGSTVAVTLIEKEGFHAGQGRGQQCSERTLANIQPMKRPCKILASVAMAPTSNGAKINATIPNAKDRQDVNIDMRFELYRGERSQKGGKKKPRAKKPAERRNLPGQKEACGPRKNRLRKKKAPAKKKHEIAVFRALEQYDLSPVMIICRGGPERDRII